ncbi:putative GTP pyrophosphokinase [Acholeplasma morum]|jgi:putative GTP pyrophosphokinase|uniref:GTP pyrophosphokinase n=1 Tax=Paracholeplasma morum TaxID=264637 RepID=UPI0019589B43|nr:GTP pyrophosphokinase family protein [Paracholeplasma morum]MBM7453305.1 putative GTP pyrophosphokinase [Paracholeplasma morum]
MSAEFEKNLFTEMSIQPPVEFQDSKDEYKKLMMAYYAAMREVQTKFEILNDELNLRHSRNPIEFIKVRIKKSQSILDKLSRYGLDKTLDNLKQINDIAGVRIVCTYVDDIYEIANMFVRQDDVTLVQIKDYIKKPKPNGYRSLHLTIEIPVYFSDSKRKLRVEVQIRTIAMDFWASLEHDMKYKKDLDILPALKEELKQCAEVIADTDIRMQKIKNRLDEGNQAPIEKSENSL